MNYAHAFANVRVIVLEDGNNTIIALSENACKIEFKLAYEFSSPWLSQLISPIFSQIANTFVDSFVTRADNILK